MTNFANISTCKLYVLIFTDSAITSRNLESYVLCANTFAILL